MAVERTDVHLHDNVRCLNKVNALKSLCELTQENIEYRTFLHGCIHKKATTFRSQMRDEQTLSAETRNSLLYCRQTGFFSLPISNSHDNAAIPNAV